ncbi:MAG TPA: PilZ domain-containing protein [Pseudomonadales bacterium]
MASTGQFNVVCSGDLSVQLHRTGILGVFRRSIAAECLRFSISGIQIETPAELKIGESVVMDLVVNDLRVEELEGVVRSASAAADKHYYEIEFRMDSNTRANTLHCLRHIDTHVRQQLNAAG